MRIFSMIIILMVTLGGVALGQYQIDWYVIGSGGGHSESGSYQLDGTIGQPIVGTSTSASYIIEAGFWVGAAVAGGCAYIPGDINGSGGPNGIDVTYGVAYLKGGNAPPDSCDCPPIVFPFYGAMDVNGTCSTNGIDITYFVSYLKGGQPALLFCDDCPPAGMMAPPGPAVMPIESPLIRVKGVFRSND